MAVRGSALIFPDATARRFWRDHKINYTVEVMPKNPTNESKGTSSKTTSSEEVIPFETCSTIVGGVLFCQFVSQ